MNRQDPKRSHHTGIPVLPQISINIGAPGPRLMPDVHGGNAVNVRQFVNNHFANYSSIVEAARREEYLRLLNKVDISVPMGRLDHLRLSEVNSLTKSPHALEDLAAPHDHLLPPQSFGSRRRQELLEIMQSSSSASPGGEGEKKDLRKTDWVHKDDALPEFDSLVLKGFYAATIDESHKKLGDHYCLALTEGLKRRESSVAVTVVILKDNRLSDSGLGRIVPLLPTQLRVLDVSENVVRKKAAESLKRHLCLSRTLIKLDLRKTSLSDSCVKAIAHGIARSCDEGNGTGSGNGSGSALTTLVLAENKIGDSGAAYLARVLPSCSLTTLDLSWNEIKSAGASAIAESLLQNTTLASLDLSWNAIGSASDKERKIADNLSTLLSENTVLTHLDLSQNQLSASDCGKIGEGLKNNHSLLGLHITGNGGKIDAYGQLMPDAEPWPLEAGHAMTRTLGGRSEGRDKWSLRNACWICSWWRETRFWHTASATSVKRAAHKKQKEYDALVEEIEALSTAPLPLPPNELLLFLGEGGNHHHGGDDLTTTVASSFASSSGRRGSDSTLGSLESIATSVASKAGGVDAKGKEKNKAKKSKNSKKNTSKKAGDDENEGNVDDDKSVATNMTSKTSKSKAVAGAAHKEHPFIVAARAEREDALRVLHERANALNRVIVDFEGRGVTAQLATSFDKWVPEEMPLLAPEKGDDKREFELYRMVPPGMHYFVFTVCKGEYFYDQNQPTVPTNEAIDNGMFVPQGVHLPEYVNTAYAEELSAEDKLQGHKALFYKLTQHGRRALIPREGGGGGSVSTATDTMPEGPSAPLPQVVKPRLRNEGQAIAVRVKGWSIEDSIFFAADKAALFKQKDVIQRDWDYCRSSQMKDKEVAKRCFSLLQQHFGLIKDIYITYASVYSTEVFFMGIGAFNEVLTRCGILVVETSESMSGSVTSKKSRAVKGSVAKASIFMRNKHGSQQDPMIAAIQEAVDAVEHMTEDEEHTLIEDMEQQLLHDDDDHDDDNHDNNNGDSEKDGHDDEVEAHSDEATTVVKTTPSQKRRPILSAKKLPIACSRTDVDLCFTANCITGPKHEANGKRYLNRFQFIDCLIALSHTRYVGPGVCKDKAEAFERMIVEDLLPSAEREDPFVFRKTYAMTEQIDTVLKNNMSFLERIYKNFSGADNTPTEQKSMSLREWMDLCDVSGHEAYGLGERAVKLSYSRSLSVYKDAFDGQELFRKMYFLEFLEAVVRAAYFIRASGVVPPSDDFLQGNTGAADDSSKSNYHPIGTTAATAAGGGAAAGGGGGGSARGSEANSRASTSRRRSSGNIVNKGGGGGGLPVDAAAIAEASGKHGGGGGGIKQQSSSVAATATASSIVPNAANSGGGDSEVTVPQLAETLLETIRRMKPKTVNKGGSKAAAV